MPVKNGEKYLVECIESILLQSFQDWELIIINDHSTDTTADILTEFEENNSKIKSLVNNGLGIINALQLGLEKTSGKFVTRMDSDDIMPENRLEIMMDSILNSDTGTVVTGLVKYISDQPVSEGYLNYEAWLNQINLNASQWQNIYRECVIASPNWIIRKTDLMNSGGFDDLQYPEDYDLVFSWYRNHYDVVCIPKVTLHWREHPARTSRNSHHYIQKAFFDLKVSRFLELELEESSLIIWGKNPKTRFTKDFLKSKGIDCHQYDLKDYRKIEDFSSPKLLVGVYPDVSERLKLEDYLKTIGLSQGSDWWYL